MRKADRVARDRQIAESYSNGYSLRQLGKTYDISHTAIARAVVRGGGTIRSCNVKARNGGKKVELSWQNAGKTRERNASIARTYLSGVTLRELADIFVMSRNGIREILIKEGVERRSAGSRPGLPYKGLPLIPDYCVGWC